MALACLISYVVATRLLNPAVNREHDVLGAMWATIATAFVFRETRLQSLSAGSGRLIATSVSFALCLPYLWLVRPTAIGMAIVFAAGTLVLMLLGRRDDIIVTAATTIVVMVLPY